MQQISDFYPYKNTVMMDKERTLEWSNGAMLEAIKYYKDVSEEDVTFDFIQTELYASKLRAVQALLFGALRAEQPAFTLKMFGEKYRHENLESYVQAVFDGMVHYFPDSDKKDPGVDLDPDWPDTQQEIKKKTKRKPKQIGDTGTGSIKSTALRINRS